MDMHNVSQKVDRRPRQLILQHMHHQNVKLKVNESKIWREI